MATVGTDGPHVTALWFVWDGQSVWLTSIVRSQRWTDVERDPRMTVLVDAGEGYAELRGVEIRGRPTGGRGAPHRPTHRQPAEPERLFGAKYRGGVSPMMVATAGCR